MDESTRKGSGTDSADEGEGRFNRAKEYVGDKYASASDAMKNQYNRLPESSGGPLSPYPIGALLLGFGAGVWLGMKKGDEVIAAGTSMVTATAMSNVSAAMERFGGSSE